MLIASTAKVCSSTRLPCDCRMSRMDPSSDAHLNCQDRSRMFTLHVTELQIAGVRTTSSQSLERSLRSTRPPDSSIDIDRARIWNLRLSPTPDASTRRRVSAAVKFCQRDLHLRSRIHATHRRPSRIDPAECLDLWIVRRLTVAPHLRRETNV